MINLLTERIICKRGYETMNEIVKAELIEKIENCNDAGLLKALKGFVLGYEMKIAIREKQQKCCK